MINPISHIEYIWNEKNYFIMKNNKAPSVVILGHETIKDIRNDQKNLAQVEFRNDSGDVFIFGIRVVESNREQEISVF